MKQKTLLKMISIGTHKYFAEPDGTWLADRAAELYYGYCLEHQNDSPARKQHTEGMIYAGVALYQALQEKGQSPEEALALMDKIFQDFAQEAAKKIRKLLKIPGLYRQFPKLFRTMALKKYNTEAGFQMKFYDVGKRRIKLDITACPYYSTCKSMGCPELTTIFCNTDDCCYGNMHRKLQWNRTKTIGRGADLCDFDIVVKD